MRKNSFLKWLDGIFVLDYRFEGINSTGYINTLPTRIIDFREQFDLKHITEVFLK